VAVHDDEARIATDVAGNLPHSTALLTDAGRNVQRIIASTQARHLTQTTARLTHAVDEPCTDFAAGVARGLTRPAAPQTDPVSGGQPPEASVVARDLVQIAACLAESSQHPEPRLAAVVATRLVHVTAYVAQAVAHAEGVVTTPWTGFAAANPAFVTNAGAIETARSEITTQPLADAAGRCLLRVGWAARNAIGVAARKATMRCRIAAAGGAHLFHVPVVRRVELAVGCPLGGPRLGTIAAHLARCAARRYTRVLCDVAAEVLVARNDSPDAGNARGHCQLNM
jgi:hypothetical protein